MYYNYSLHCEQKWNQKTPHDGFLLADCAYIHTYVEGAHRSSNDLFVLRVTWTSQENSEIYGGMQNNELLIKLCMETCLSIANENLFWPTEAIP